jgi:HAD superfamily hydrolase (TIGR01509 family)
MDRRSVDALLFDIGGVVLEIDFGRAFARWAAHSGERAETLGARFSFDTFYDRHERGEIKASEYFASLRSSLGIDLSDAEFTDGWTAIYVGEIAPVVARLRSLRDRVPLYAFTNSNPTHQRVWARDYAASLSCFRKVFVSSELGWRKPEPEAFAAIATTIGAPLERILFFDDTKANVDGALAVGMQAVHVRSVQDIDAALVGLVPPIREP